MFCFLCLHHAQIPLFFDYSFFIFSLVSFLVLTTRTSPKGRGQMEQGGMTSESCDHLYRFCSHVDRPHNNPTAFPRACDLLRSPCTFPLLLLPRCHPSSKLLSIINVHHIAIHHRSFLATIVICHCCVVMVTLACSYMFHHSCDTLSVDVKKKKKKVKIYNNNNQTLTRKRGPNRLVLVQSSFSKNKIKNITG